MDYFIGFEQAPVEEVLDISFLLHKMKSSEVLSTFYRWEQSNFF